MAQVDSIISKVDAILRQFNVTDRTVCKRLVTRTGGDPLIGQGVTKSYVDTVLDPPPSYQRLGRNVVGNYVKAESVLLEDSSRVQVADDYSCMVSPSAISAEELANPDVLIVFKDANNAEEVFRITDFEPVPFQGKDALFLTFLRSTKRGI